MTNAELQVFTPSQINRLARDLLESEFPSIWLEGEISNLARPASGHLYFSLKDEQAQIRCALFRGNASRLRFRPENGQKVRARGRISLYQPRGDYQLIADALEPAGEGELQRRFEALKKQLQQEGLFAEEHKQPLPEYPSRMAVITSPSGAAIRDILQIARRRWPLLRIRVYPVPVQGDEAAPAIAQALRAADQQQWAEVIIVGRGGGSLEDLWAFNEEPVARAIHECSIPVVSAVGHEIDLTISDFVADVRAATPTAAVEIIAPDQNKIRQDLERLQSMLRQRSRQMLQQQTQGLDYLQRRLLNQHPMQHLKQQAQLLQALQSRLALSQKNRLGLQQQKTREYSARLRSLNPARKLQQQQVLLQTQKHRLTRLMRRQFAASSGKLAQLAKTLNALSPLSALARGYAVIRDETGSEVISSIDATSPGERVVAELADGELSCLVEAVTHKQEDRG